MSELTVFKIWMRVLVGALWASLLAAAAPAAAAKQKVTEFEILQLPKFCWEQMGSAVAKGPEFRIPKGCGPGMNHYCPGLVQLVRAKQELDSRKRLSRLGSAERAVKYTLGWLKDYPKCPIRGHVDATLAEIKRLKLGAGSQK